IAIDTIAYSRTGSFNGGVVVRSGGQVSATTLFSGGFEVVSQGGVDIGGTVVLAGGSLVASSGGTTDSVFVTGTVTSNVATFGRETVANGGTASGTMLSGAG